MDNLISIDYLILNLNGSIAYTDDSAVSACSDELDTGNDNIFFLDNFGFELSERGTKNFANRYTIFYGSVRFGVLCANPYDGSVLAPDFAQLQIDNALFYTHRNDLKRILQEFFRVTNYQWKAINRMDIAMDSNDYGKYSELYSNLMDGKVLIAGRKKAVSSYAEMQCVNAFQETHKGQVYLNGFYVGKRTATRMLRVYNKTLNLRLTPKDYITQFHKDNGLTDECDVWRFEYQLNAKFFTDLYKHRDVVVPDGLSNTEPVTWAIFDIENLIELLRLAQKNHFELRENTGKSQINKENEVLLHCWDDIKALYTSVKSTLQKIPKIIDRTNVVLKRLSKSLFREYYVNGQDLSYIIALNHLLDTNTDYDPETKKERSLRSWFEEKKRWYLAEFHTKERIKDTFDELLYSEHSLITI